MMKAKAGITTIAAKKENTIFECVAVMLRIVATLNLDILSFSL